MCPDAQRHLLFADQRVDRNYFYIGQAECGEYGGKPDATNAHHGNGVTGNRLCHIEYGATPGKNGASQHSRNITGNVIRNLDERAMINDRERGKYRNA
jgi:hypothetical protein